jgi:hypothetical protein
MSFEGIKFVGDKQHQFPTAPQHATAFVQNAGVRMGVFEDFNHGYAIKALVLEGKTLAGSLDARNAGGDRFQEIELHV